MRITGTPTERGANLKRLEALVVSPVSRTRYELRAGQHAPMRKHAHREGRGGLVSRQAHKNITESINVPQATTRTIDKILPFIPISPSRM